MEEIITVWTRDVPGIKVVQYCNLKKVIELEIEYECYGVRTISPGRYTRTPSPQEERELITKGEDFGDVLAEAVQTNKVAVVDRLEFKAIDTETGNDWHIRRIDLTEAVEEVMKEKLQLLTDALEDSDQNSGDNDTSGR